MSVRYPKSRLPGPAVRLFDLDVWLDGEATVQRHAHEATTAVAPPEVEWALLPDCRRRS